MLIVNNNLFQYVGILELFIIGVFQDEKYESNVIYQGRIMYERG